MSPGRSAASTGGVMVFDHTADVGLAVKGAGREELFLWAARGLARVALDPAWLRRAERRPGDEPAVRLLEVLLGPAPDLEALLVHWLNHLIYLLETERLAVVDGELTIEDIGEEHAEGSSPGSVRLRGTVRAVPVPPGAQRIAVKAATFHGLAVKGPRADGGYTARIVLDV